MTFPEVVSHLLPYAWVTIQLTALGCTLGLFMSFAAGLARLTRNVGVRFIARAYSEFFRGSSLLVQVFLLFYVLPLFGLSAPAMLTGVLALGLNSGAYGSEIVQSAIRNVPRGQREATVALNMSSSQSMRFVVLPQAVVTMMPSFGNLAIELLKSTPFVSVITITELTYAAQNLVNSHGNPTGTYLALFLFYLALAIPLIVLARWLERRFAVGLQLGRPV